MNGESLTYLVYWDLPLLHTYLYGTTLRHTRDGVEFTNRMMPSGQIIHSWNSELNYQDVRTQAQLPVLEENKTYHLVPFIDAVPEHTIVLQITFFDRQGQQIGFQVIHRDGNFTYPQGAYRYRLDLVQAGAESFRFHHLEIRTKETEDAKPVFCNRDILSRRICIYLPELSHTRMVRFPDPDSLSFLDNLTLAPTSLVVPPPFFRDDFLKNLPRKGRQWIFVTTGESSLRAAEQLSIRCPGSAILSAENAAALLRQEYQIREPV